ncbi:MAG: glutathione peroxidase [Bacteroidetes bacterium]|nr:MAG: glutathione peroxidase [Bacteroidota bacterium]
MKKIFKYIGISFTAILGACARPAERPLEIPVSKASSSIYSIKLTDINGGITDLSVYKGKKMLIVNTASKCGYTHQYADLERLHKEYGDKIVVLGFPCNQFGGQEPGTAEEIGAFCQKNYGVTFPLFEKSNVKGADKSELYSWLTDKSKNGWNEQEPSWNFCKYVIDEKGQLLAFYPSKTDPFDERIISLLK